MCRLSYRINLPETKAQKCAISRDFALYRLDRTKLY